MHKIYKYAIIKTDVFLFVGLTQVKICIYKTKVKNR